MTTENTAQKKAELSRRIVHLEMVTRWTRDAAQRHPDFDSADRLMAAHKLFRLELDSARKQFDALVWIENLEQHTNQLKRGF